MKKRGGQITIFIIVAIVIIAIIALFALLKFRLIPSSLGNLAEENPSEFLRVCLEDSVKEKVDTIMNQGGSLANPSNISFRFDEEEKYYDVSFLCYNRATGPCVNQQPNLIGHVENEIHDWVEDDFQSCFGSLIQSLEKSGYDVESDSPYDFEVKIDSEKIEIASDETLSITKNEQKKKISGAKFYISDKELYKILSVATKIVNSESTDCNFDYVDYMLMDNKIDISKFTSTDSVEIYTIKDIASNKWFRFAVRGNCLSLK